MIQGEIHKFQITDINNEGEGVVRAGDGRFVLFVPDALQGEEVTARILRIKKNYGIAKVIERHNDSPARVTPVCPSFGRCGGCQLQHMKYTEQLNLKTKTVIDALKRIGGISDPNVKNCVASPTEWGYRNKASLPTQSMAHEKFIAGFYRPRSHDIVKFEQCPVLLPSLEKNVTSIINDIRKNNFYGCKVGSKNNVTEFIRHIVFRSSKFLNESLCGVIGNRNLNGFEIKKLVAIAEKNSASLNGFIYNKNTSSGNFIWGDKFTLLYGTSTIHELLAPYRFTFEISSFFQINSEQALNIYNYAAQLVLDKSPRNILELYSGIGSMTAFLAAVAKNVTAVESWRPAAKYMDENARTNGLNNITGYTGTAEEILKGLSDKKFDVVVVDPPRSGCTPEVINSIIKIAPERIVYVSCNPATLARDIRLLLNFNYKIITAQPFDMFPQTGHVECVALMERG
ncbi:MAG: 23S rRNA (uracil(1939)-C(5))-methyltransferase RlmD [Synergistaceae bacterium]|nr:23S rRNA (uracil(1939)-C(5))-methyltransferase RlmD [Synergistaceae bacterium]